MARVCPECGQRYGDAELCEADGTQLAVARGLVGQVVGNYVIVGVLGAGGMGTVYRAIQPAIGARVAIKVMRMVPDERETAAGIRFFGEARTAGQLRHDHIVKVLDAGHLEDHRPYLVMEHLDGAPLSEIIRRSAPLPIGTTLHLMGQVLGALDAAHARGVIHRDLKPGNLFVTTGGRAVVLDFGIAKLRLGSGSPRLTATGSPVGTPAYMPPEQIRGGEVDGRADLYSAGVVLYEALTGRRPFSSPSESEFEVMSMHLEQAPLSPRSLREEVPAAVEDAILTALAKSPDRRYDSAPAMAAALAEAGANLPEEAWAELSIPEWPAPDRLVKEAPASPPPSSQGAGGRVGWTRETAPARPRAETKQERAGRLELSPASTPQERSEPREGSLAAPAAGIGPTRPSGRRLPLWIALLGLGVALGLAIPNLHLGFSGSERSPEGDAAPSISPEVSHTEASAGLLASAPGDAGPAVAGPAVAGPAPPPDSSPEDASPVPGAGKTEGAGRARTGRAAASKGADGARPNSAESEAGRSGGSSEASRPTEVKWIYKPNPNPSSFNVHRYLRVAVRRAREAFPDARFVRIVAGGVRPSGLADLTLDSDFYVTYNFVSPSAARRERPKEVPRGVEYTPICNYQVLVSSDEIQRSPLPSRACERDVPIRRPRCSLRAVWEKAIARGAPAQNAVATLVYYAVEGKPTWAFQIGKGEVELYPDDC